MKILIDTNVLVSALSSRSVHHWIIKELLDEKLDLFVTDEILLEYEEILTTKYSSNVANNFLAALKQLPNVHFTYVYLRWQLLLDKDDNKFVDCAISANADYLVTNDKHYNILKQINFPKVSVVTIQQFEVITKNTKAD